MRVGKSEFYILPEMKSIVSSQGVSISYRHPGRVSRVSRLILTINLLSMPTARARMSLEYRIRVHTGSESGVRIGKEVIVTSSRKCCAELTKNVGSRARLSRLPVENR